MGIGLRGEYTLQVADREVLLKFGTNSTAVFCEKHDISLQEFQNRFSADQLQIRDIRDFIWAAAVAGAHATDREIDFDRWDVGDWIDELSQEELDRILSIMEDSGEAELKNSPGPEATEAPETT